MKLKKQFFRKLLIGAVLILVSAGITMLIKESLDTKDPESSLPIISITCGEVDIPPDAVYRAGYEWSFFATMARRDAPSVLPEDLPISPFPVYAGEPMQITFTTTPSEIRVWRAEGRYGTEFLEVSGEEKGMFATPTTPGIYMFRVLADWGGRGNIQYYFSLDVQSSS